jgi:hypothetical protein
MYIGVKEVTPSSDYKLNLLFENGERRLFDMSPLLDKGIYQTLKEGSMFNRVKVTLDFIEWPNGVDIDPDRLYEESIKLG